MSKETRSLSESIAAGEYSVLLSFPGQDPGWAEDLAEMLVGRVGLRRWCEHVLEAVSVRLAEDVALHPDLAVGGIRVEEWLDGGANWTAGKRASGPLCLMGSLLSHLVGAAILAEDGIGVDVGQGAASAVTGHSSGLLAAWLVARHGSLVPPDAAANAMLALAVMAAAAERSGPLVSPAVVQAVLEGNEGATPMMAVAGVTEPKLMSQLGRLSYGSVEVSLQNSWDRWVLSGEPVELEALGDALAKTSGVRTNMIASSCGYHHSSLAVAVERATVRLEGAGLGLSGSLAVPLIDPRDGTRLEGGELTERIVASTLLHPVRWADTLNSSLDTVEVIVDAGPSTVTASLTRRAVEGSGVLVVAAGDASGRRALNSVEDRPAPEAAWDIHRPRIRRDAAHRIHTRHTERSGRSAMVLAGMTPTTVDTTIVAAAANKGNIAELAGGGQVSAAVFAERLADLSDRLTPGHEVVFNALHLDPYLWNLHLGQDRMVQQARIEGAPICGVTVSAGIPDVSDAIALLDELNDLGIWLNAFKPGNVAGVRKVLEIADGTDHQVWLHLEGGLAGGHHSWQDLEDVMFATYADIRRHDNVTLVVGGGVGTPERAAELLGGTWALRHGARPMPVDGVLLGTVAMACAESTASPSVKAALVAAKGTNGSVLAGEARGGVVSGRSGLGADIHYLDNHAARVAAMLEDVSGDANAVADRHDEIADSLSRTAKPWFGDLTHMTWLETVGRFVELCALGRHGRFENGRWLDITHRQRFLRLLRRAEQRCVDLDEGTFSSVFEGLDDLDDPLKAVDQLRSHYPSVEHVVLGPADVAAVIAICDAPGKPVPFVVVIDAEVRRRYLADSLWQAHSDLWNADEVLVIPGPSAVAGIAEAEEPVSALLARFDAEVAEILEASGAAEIVDMTTDPMVVPSSAVESALRLRRVKHGAAMIPSPLLALGSTHDGWTITHEGDSCVAELRNGKECARLAGPAAPTGRVELTLTWPSLADIPGDGRLHMELEIEIDNGVVIGSMDEGSLASAETSILTMLREAASLIAERRRSDDRDNGKSKLPDASMVGMWSPIFSALDADGAGHGLLRLVHARHQLERAAKDSGTPINGEGATTAVAPSAEVVGRGHMAAGRRIEVRATDGLHIVNDEFLIRNAAGNSRSSSSDSRDSLESSVQDRAEDGQDSHSDSDSDPWVSTPRHFLARRSVRAPRHSEAFALVSGDANPIHRSDLVARLAGLPGRIVHGMWTSRTAQSLVVDELLDGDALKLVGWDIVFLDMVLPDSELQITATRVGARHGHRRIEIRVDHDGTPVALAHADLAPQRTAYVFTGQGIQSQGMGLDALERSPAARGVWERAERHCRQHLGFSVIEVVKDNPELLVVDGETHRHPAGVLHLTQFTQVAMATLAAAQVGELREAGVLDTNAIVAGHSVGEYNALASLGDVLPLEVVLSVVWARGTAMHHLVPRDASGASNYRLGVIRPHLADLDARAATQIVDDVASSTGELCQIVNHNLRDRQYAVAGTVSALSELEARLGSGTVPGRPPFLMVPGIDVPFHSRALSDGVPEFRAHLDAALPREIDPDLLVGRYVPNLYPQPFSLDRDYVEAVATACEGRAATLILDNWDEMQSHPRRLARELLVELLAWQFASPVRWIETTDVLLTSTQIGGLGVQRVVEMGLGSAPTLTNLTRAAVIADGRRGIEVLHVEVDSDAVLELTTKDEPVPEPIEERDVDPLVGADFTDDWDGDAPGPAKRRATRGAPSPSAAPTAPAAASPQVSSAIPPAGGASETPDRPMEVAESLATLLSHLTHVRLDQLGDDSIDDLVDGASSRRNQVLMDLGKEFGVGSVDGAQDLVRSAFAELIGPMVRSYRYPGPVLSAALSAGVGAALGPFGESPGFVARHLRAQWGLGDGWADRCSAELFLGMRDGASRRGGELRSLDKHDTASALVDAALMAAAKRVGTELRRPVVESTLTVGGEELDALRDRVNKAFAQAATAASTALGGVPETVEKDASVGAADSADRDRLRLLDLEHGHERAAAVTPLFDRRKIRCLDSTLAWARARLDHLYHDSLSGRLDESGAEELIGQLQRFYGSSERFDATVMWYRTRATTAGEAATVSLLDKVAQGPTPQQRRAAMRLGARTVLISGASPGSIGEATAGELLAAGATVVMVTHSAGRDRRLAVRELLREHGGPGARLFLVSANLASFTDIDRLVDWLGESRTEDHPGRPDVVLPFAASPVSGDAPDSSPANELELRVLLLGVERLVGRLAEAAGSAPGSCELTAVLPMSPNHGTFGGDGSYGHSKAGLEVLEARRLSEFDRWGRYCRIIGAQIGWVRGTALMGANDTLAPIVEHHLGVRTYSAAEMGSLIAELCAPEQAGGLESAPGKESNEGSDSSTGVTRVDFTGGLAEAARSGSLARLLRTGLPTNRAVTGSAQGTEEDADAQVESRELAALTTAERSLRVPMMQWPSDPLIDADEMVVICGTGEIGPWGMAATRAMAERDGTPGGSGIVELALACGLVQWSVRGLAGEYVDTESGDLVAEDELVAKYRTEVLARCGIRPIADNTYDQDVEVFLDRPVTIGLDDQDTARAFAAAATGATATRDGDHWKLTLPAGAPVRLRRSAELPRDVTAAIPDGMSPTSFGVPVELASAIDPLAAWNLAVTAEAFRDAGTSPEELLAAVHPSRIGNSQGTGMGGVTSLRGLNLDPVLAVPHANDMLQEALGNVCSAHVMQSLVGGYGPMVHPVAACATAAVSLEVAVDMIALDKADIVVSGGLDDLSREGIIGFADMAATADCAEMSAAGFEPSEMSRPGDRGRAGFVESQGGGSFVVCRGSVARRLGLPVRAVVGLARSYSDGVQNSIPAPGLGAVAVAVGGDRSPLALALKNLGLTADDISVVSKHDTSTRANDPNEAAIHDRLCSLLGRSNGNPLRVVSQKSLTGHSKGGSAAWQIAGICDVFDSAVVPGNRNLDSVDVDVQVGPLVPDDRALTMAAPPLAALVTSLGFGHVSAVVLLVHPDVFEAALAPEDRAGYTATATKRRADTEYKRRWAMHGGVPSYRRPDGRRFGAVGAVGGAGGAGDREFEMEVLSDPEARLSEAGTFITTAGSR